MVVSLTSAPGSKEAGGGDNWVTPETTIIEPNAGTTAIKSNVAMSIRINLSP
jgi:hypothetical protein